MACISELKRLIFFWYHSADFVIPSISFSVNCLTTFAGDPIISEFSGKVLPYVTSEQAPTKQFFAILAPFKIVDPIPIRVLSSITHP